MRPEVAFVIDGFCAFPTPSCVIGFSWGEGLGLVHCGEFKHSHSAWMSLEAKYTGPRRLAAHLLAPLVHSTPGPRVSTTGVSPRPALVHKLPPAPALRLALRPLLLHPGIPRPTALLGSAGAQSQLPPGTAAFCFDIEQVPGPPRA